LEALRVRRFAGLLVKAFDPRAALPLSTAAFHIMLALAEADSHGYTIGKQIEAQTGGAVRLGPATLYRTIKQLLVDGWITEVTRDEESGDDERRRYYRLTPHGRRIAEAEAHRLEDLVNIARSRRLLPSLALGQA
jgi:DNA-binding PadR family transcriptional regulator